MTQPVESPAAFKGLQGSTADVDRQRCASLVIEMPHHTHHCRRGEVSSIGGGIETRIRVDGMFFDVLIVISAFTPAVQGSGAGFAGQVPAELWGNRYHVQVPGTPWMVLHGVGEGAGARMRCVDGTVLRSLGITLGDISKSVASPLISRKGPVYLLWSLTMSAYLRHQSP